MGKQGKFYVAGVVVVLALGYSMYSAFSSAATYYLTIAELKAQGESVYTQPVRVSGKVNQGTIDQDIKNLTIRFTMVDGVETLPVVYRGVVPDLFYNSDATVVVEGQYTREGVLEGKKLLAKCPSKYEAEVSPET